MLGFDYLGQAAIGSLGIDKIIISIKEKFYANENLELKAHYVITVLESISLSDSISSIIVNLLTVIEKMSVKDETKLNFMIVVAEIAKIVDKAYSIQQIIIKELMNVADTIISWQKIIVQEIMLYKETIRINGQILVAFWEACLEKGEALVQNVYRKFRQ